MGGGNTLLKILVVEYIIIAVAYIVGGNYPKAVYFIGAVILSLGVLWM